VKKENISVQMEAEKLRATKKYMEKKEVSLEQELADSLLKLYEKYVPAPVREYIDEAAEDTASAQRKAKEKNRQTTSPTQQP